MAIMDSVKNDVPDADVMRDGTLMLFPQHFTLGERQPIVNETVYPLEFTHAIFDIVIQVVERTRLGKQEIVRQTFVGTEQDEVRSLITGGVNCRV